MPPFHLAIPVNSLEKARGFYGKLLGCEEGRSAEKWIDYDFFGHQLSIHLKPEECGKAAANKVDGDNVPVRHFGAILEWNEWEKLSSKLKAANTEFIIEPHVRFKGEPGEQGTFFLLDPAGNALEFKTFKDIKNQLFKRDGNYNK